jgi:hypothetical protein
MFGGQERGEVKVLSVSKGEQCGRRGFVTKLYGGPEATVVNASSSLSGINNSMNLASGISDLNWR